VLDEQLGRLVVEPQQPNSDFLLFLAAWWHYWLLAIVMHVFRVPKAPDAEQIKNELLAAFFKGKGEVQ